jgi:hypothetical protein
MRRLLDFLWQEWKGLQSQIESLNTDLEQIASSDPSCVRLQQIPGVGPLISTAVVSAIGNGAAFKKGREFAAWLGLVPRQWSTGGKAKLLGISKRGNPYLRKMFIHGARAAVLGWHSPASECCGVWSADGRYYFFVGTDSASSNIWALPEPAGLFHKTPSTPLQLTNGPMSLVLPVPSPDGKKLFALGFLPRGELVVYDSKSRQFLPFLSGISAHMLDFSRDGKLVAYVSVPDDHSNRPETPRHPHPEASQGGVREVAVA